MLSDSGECRQFEDAVERGGAGVCERHIDFAAVWRGGDAVEPVIPAQRTAMYLDSSDCHHGPVLPHSHDRVVATVANLEIGTVLERTATPPVDTSRLSLPRPQTYTPI